MQPLDHYTRSFCADERGTAMIEMGLVLSFLILPIGLGAIEFGNYYYKYQLVENAVRDGARFAGSLSNNVCSDLTLKEKVRVVVKRTSEEGSFWNSAIIDVTCASFDNSSNTYRGPSSIKTVTVTATVPYASLGFLGFLKLGNLQLVAAHQERVVGG